MPLHANLNLYLKWFALRQPGIWEPRDNGASAVRFRDDHILPFRGLCSIWLFSYWQGIYCSFSLLIFMKLIFIYLHIDIWTCVISILIHRHYFMSVLLFGLGMMSCSGSLNFELETGSADLSWSLFIKLVLNDNLRRRLHWENSCK